jgi:hypothetical protein
MPSYVHETGGGDFQLVPQGAHIAICDMVINLGVQETAFGSKNQHYIRWQIPGETVDTENGPKPMVIGNFYTSSLSEKANLRKDLEAWRSKAFTKEELEKFDLFAILGKPCQVSVIHAPNKKGNMNAYINGVMALPKGVPAPKIFGDPIGYDAQNAPGTFNALPEWLQKKINTEPPKSKEEDTSTLLDEEFDDDIPF